VERVPVDRRSEDGLDQLAHLAGSGMSIEGGLGEDERTIELHLEPAAAARNERRTADQRRPGVEELSHQTGGSRDVVSDDAELDLKLVRFVRRIRVHRRTVRFAVAPRLIGPFDCHFVLGAPSDHSQAS